jgi:hypothetical protein
MSARGLSRIAGWLALPVAPRAQGIAFFRFGVLAVLLVLAPWSSLEAAPIEVRFAEGAANGLLLVRSVSGETVGDGASSPC